MKKIILFLLFPLILNAQDWFSTNHWKLSGTTLQPVITGLTRMDLMSSLTPKLAVGSKTLFDSVPGNWNPVIQAWSGTQTWQAAIQSVTQIEDATFTGSTHIVGTFNQAVLEISSGTQNEMISGINNQAKATLTGTAAFGANDGIRGMQNNVVTASTAGTAVNVIGCETLFSPLTGANDRWTNVYGSIARFDGGTGSLAITNYYGFYSDPTTKHANTTITSGYHFYGKGDYDSYFGGNVYVGADSTRGVVLKSADGTNWRIKVANDGALSADSTGVN